jgi:MFS family permease
MVENKQSRFHYGYLIVLLGFWIIVIGSAGNVTFGVFFEPLLTEFGWTRAVTSGAMSISGFIAGLFNIITGRLSDRFGPRLVITIACLFSGLGLILLSRINALWQLYACFGIIAIGGSGFLVPIMATVTRWFVKRRGMMTSIIISALGTCEMMLPPLARWLISSYGWRQSYLIVGLSVIVLIASAGQFIRRDPSQLGKAPYGGSQVKQDGLNLQLAGYSLAEAIRIREFWILGAIMLCYFFGQSSIMTHIVILATGLGISRVSAANILVIIGGAYIASLNITGNAVDRIGKKPASAIGFILQSVALFGLVGAKEVWMLYLCAVLLGLGRGCAMAPMPLLMADIFGLRSFGVIQGAIFFGATSGSIIGPILTGHIFDTTGSYFFALLSCGAATTIGLILTLLIRTNAGTRHKSG